MLVDLLQTSLSRILADDYREFIEMIQIDHQNTKFLLICDPPPKAMQDSCEASLSALAGVNGGIAK